MPVFDLPYCNQCTLSNHLARMVHKLVQVLLVFRLACHCCQSLMSNDILLLLVLDALSNQGLLLSLLDAYLPQDKAYLVFEEGGLALEVLLGEKFAKL